MHVNIDELVLSFRTNILLSSFRFLYITLLINYYFHVLWKLYMDKVNNPQRDEKICLMIIFVT